ncbi:MAG: exodeoxyribonuclease VII large subunit, partial [Anaerolineales bacterium]
MYFTLKDEQAALRCVMWRNQVARLPYEPQDGDRVVVRGQVSVYEASGQYQLYAAELRLAGVGDLYQQFEALKEKLDAEGLFDPKHKQPLPAWPTRIALVTSPTGAAIRDMLHVIGRRWPSAEVIIVPTTVQGAAAPAEIVAALDSAHALTLDVILLARGGGSIEDLWAFNDESVARAIFGAKTPIVSGVGHETDFTIADFVADVRAPTPSAAAEIATPDQREVRQRIDSLLTSLADTVTEAITHRRWALAEQQATLWGLSPRAQLAAARQRVAGLAYRALLALRHSLRLQRERVHGLQQALAGLGPPATLARGYAIVTRAGTRDVVRAVDDVTAGEQLDVRVADGQFGATVNQNDEDRNVKTN